MNQKNPSISSAVALVGVGLISLSCAEIIAASARPALAAPSDQRPVWRGGSTAVPSAMPASLDDSPPAMAMGDADRCPLGESRQWFGVIRELPSCVYDCQSIGGGCLVKLGAAAIGLFDVNSDGRPESFGNVNGLLVDGGVPASGTCLLEVQETSFVDGELTIERHCIFDPAPLVAIALAAGYDYAYIEDAAMGWKDVDGDQDADLVLVIYGETKGKPGGMAFWIENTGFEATQPLTGDLDGDGSVGASDLTLLLGGWTGS
jgi:hypothetical protein